MRGARLALSLIGGATITLGAIETRAQHDPVARLRQRITAGEVVLPGSDHEILWKKTKNDGFWKF